VAFPVNVASGGSVTITVDNQNSGANAVLSGVFLS
jgi:hypothetical protein